MKLLIWELKFYELICNKNSTKKKYRLFQNGGSALTLLSKLLYAVAGRTMGIEEIKTLHLNLLTESLIAYEPDRDTVCHDVSKPA